MQKMRKSRLAPAHKVGTTNTWESLFLVNMNLASREVQVWSPEFVEALIAEGKKQAKR